VIFLITTLVLLWAVVHPSSAPIKTSALRQAAQSSADEQVRAVATRFATNLSTFSYQTVDADIAKIEQDTTPNFAHTTQDALSGTIDQLKANIIAHRSVSKGTVIGALVQSIDNDTATVLVVFAQRFHNKTTPQRTDYHIFELTIVKNNGWKVSQVANPTES
jgi:hypothetical protein